MIEDAAHAIGTEYKGKRIGSFPTTSVFSFHPNKNITTGEGGMIVTDDEEVFEKVAAEVPRHGPQRVEAVREGGQPPLRHRVPGYKYNMMDIQAALGLHQLPTLDGFIDERRALAERYDAAIRRDAARCILPTPVPVAVAARLAPLHAARRRRPPDDRPRPVHGGAQGAQHRLRPPLHGGARVLLLPGAFGWKPDDFPEAHFVSERIVSLPLFPDMTDSERQDVVEAVFDIARKFRK